MSDPIEQERLQILEEREGLKDKVEADEAAEKARLIAELSVKDRLMRRLKVKTFKTVFSDDLGEFTVETRLMTSGERYRALHYNDILAKSEGDAEKYAEAIKGFKELLKDICVTEGLDEEFWESDAVSDDVVIALVMNTLYGSIESVGEAIGSFRKE